MDLTLTASATPSQNSGMLRLSAAPRLASLTVAVMCLAACAGAPVQQMSDARQAINAARAAGAADHAPGQLATAAQLLDDAERALQQHQYRMARRQAEEAHEHALAALELSAKAGEQR
jgi:hypothetical protein